jgi:hypothetical protein
MSQFHTEMCQETQCRNWNKANFNPGTEEIPHPINSHQVSRSWGTGHHRKHSYGKKPDVWTTLQINGELPSQT